MTVRFEEATPVLRSGDYDRSRAFYVDVLGFEVLGEGGDPPRFGIFRRERAMPHVDAWIGRALTDTVYGMREFEAVDPDGNVICFGEEAD